MTNKAFYISWAAMLAVCAGLGFLPEPAGGAKVICILCFLGSFVPPALLVYSSWKGKLWEQLRLVRNLALGSLGLTLAALVGNFLTAAAPEWVGDLLYAVLIIVSTPMVCSQMWVASLLLWAGLLWSCIVLLSKKK